MASTRIRGGSATYGERALNIFHLTDRSGAKMESRRLNGREAKLLKAESPAR